MEISTESQPSPTSASSSPAPPNNSYFLQRPINFLVALFVLLLIWPLFLVLALLIKLSSRGPVFFRQQRLGLHEKPFRIFKFRSMVVDADKQGPKFTSSNDRRITGIGKILRKTSLDEMPQILNVVAGHMNFIGPRPWVGFELESWRAEDRALRASVRPGISGLSQVRGRSALTPDKARELDLQYVRTCGLFRDLGLVFETAWVVLRRRGTN